MVWRQRLNFGGMASCHRRVAAHMSPDYPSCTNPVTHTHTHTNHTGRGKKEMAAPVSAASELPIARATAGESKDEGETAAGGASSKPEVEEGESHALSCYSDSEDRKGGSDACHNRVGAIGRSLHHPPPCACIHRTHAPLLLRFTYPRTRAEEAQLSFLDKYLSAWILLAAGIGACASSFSLGLCSATSPSPCSPSNGSVKSYHQSIDRFETGVPLTCVHVISLFLIQGWAWGRRLR